MASKNQYIIELSTKGASKTQKQLKGVDASLGGMAKKAGLVATAFFGAG